MFARLPLLNEDAQNIFSPFTKNENKAAVNETLLLRYTFIR
jgi:hypothetical protein